MIEVEAEGIIFEFPDETEQSVIGTAVRNYFEGEPEPEPEVQLPAVTPISETRSRAVAGGETVDFDPRTGKLIPELRQGKLPIEKKGLEKIPFVREGANQLKIAAQSLNEGLAGFSAQLDLIAGYISSVTGLEQGGAFEVASQYFQENADYWESKVRDASLIDETIGEFIGGALPGMATFMLNVPFAALEGAAGAQKEGASQAIGAAKGAAHRFLMGKILHAANVLSKPLRTSVLAGVFGIEAAATGADKREIVKAAGAGFGFGLMGGKGRVSVSGAIRERAVKRVNKEIAERKVKISEKEREQLESMEIRLEELAAQREYSKKVHAELDQLDAALRKEDMMPPTALEKQRKKAFDDFQQLEKDLAQTKQAKDAMMGTGEFAPGAPKGPPIMLLDVAGIQADVTKPAGPPPPPGIGKPVFKPKPGLEKKVSIPAFKDTVEALEFAKTATEAEVALAKSSYLIQTKKVKTLMAEGKLEEAGDVAQRASFIREMAEAAEGVHPSQKLKKVPPGPAITPQPPVTKGVDITVKPSPLERKGRTDTFFDPEFAERNVKLLGERLETLHKSLWDFESLGKSEFYDKSFAIPKEGGLIAATKTDKYTTDKSYAKKVDDTISNITKAMVDANKKRQILLGSPERSGAFGVDYNVGDPGNKDRMTFVEDESLPVGEYKVNAMEAWNAASRDRYPEAGNKLGDVSVREAMQNSLDAVLEAKEKRRIKKGEIDIELLPEGLGYSIKDNGIGMTAEDIVNKFLTLYTTGKAQEGRFGGFGIAGAVVLGPHKSAQWTLKTNDLVYTHEMTLNKERVKRVKEGIQGTSIVVGAEESIFGYEKLASKYIATTETPKWVTVKFNGVKDIPYPFKGKKGRKSTVAIGPESTGDLTYYPVAPTGYEKQLIIRLVDKKTKSKLTQSITSIYNEGFKGSIVLDITTRATPKDSDYPLSESRMSLKHNARQPVDELIGEVSVDVLSGGKVADTTTTLIGMRGEWKKTVPTIRDKKDKKYEALLDEISDIYIETGNYFGGTPDPALAITPFTLIGVEMTRGYKGPKSGSAFSARHITAFEAGIKMAAGKLNIPVEKIVGLLDESAIAAFSGGKRTAYINYSLIDKTAMKDPWSYALYIRDLSAHELTHKQHGRHDERFSSAREENGRQIAPLMPYYVRLAEAVLGKDIIKPKVIKRYRRSRKIN